MSNTFKSFFYLTLLLLVVGCDVFKEKEERPVVAKVKEHQLYLDEVLSALPENLTETDSLNFVNSFMESWATEMLLMDKAELNLPETEKDVQSQLEEYRRSLIIYKYKRQLIRQQLDTSITKEEILDYYNNNKDNFELQDNIARGVLVKLNKDSKDVDKVRKWMRSDKVEDREQLEVFCSQHALAHHLNDEVWVPFDEIINKVRETGYLNLNYFNRYSYAYVQDSTAHYLIDIKEVKYKNSVSPIEFEKENIRSILLNQRKLELTRKLEEDILKEAAESGEFEILKN